MDTLIENTQTIECVFVCLYVRVCVANT